MLTDILVVTQLQMYVVVQLGTREFVVWAESGTLVESRMRAGSTIREWVRSGSKFGRPSDMSFIWSCLFTNYFLKNRLNHFAQPDMTTVFVNISISASFS